jgi:hypothetical protein
MKRFATTDMLHDDAATGTVTYGNRTLSRLGFRPAFLDFATLAIYPSRYADGRPAPTHRIDGLPDEAVVVRMTGGRVIAPKATLVQGFERNGFFYTRTAAARAADEWMLRESAH